jgi:hypothetical protein
MIRRFTLLFLACLGMQYISSGQKCGFDEKHQQLMAQNPAFAQQVQQMKANIANLMSNPNSLVINTPGGPVYEIPVVIHVIHTSGPIGSIYNPTNAQLTGMIDYLNDSYAATWPSYPGVGAGGVDVPLRFALAKRTPDCQPTSGILRVDGSGITDYVAGGVDAGSGIGANEATVKALSIWPNTEYYNIWVVNRIDGADGTSGTFIAGFAYFPGAPANIDGTIMLATQAIAGQETLPHEVGHAFALHHTFEGDNNGTTCPFNGNCANDGDEVCDTDPHIRSFFNCPTGTNPCTGAPFGTVVHNFMDYSNCKDRFTPGQSTRVLAALISSRPSLISSLGGTAITTPVIAACIPSISNPGNSSNAGPRDIEISDATTGYMAVTSSGYNGDGNLAYVDNTCKHQVELTAGNTYDFSVRTGFNPEKVRVYVDYNNDGTFQSNELVYTHDGAANNETHSFSYTVPTTATEPSLVSCTPLRMRVIGDRSIVASVTACGPLGYGQTEDYSLVIKGGGPSTGGVTLALTSGSNPSCFGTTLIFTATPSAGITNPTYKWYVNGIFTGTNGNTFAAASLNNLDVVTATIYYTGTCGADSSFSAGFTVLRSATVPPTVSIALTGGTNPGCAGQPLTFTATPTNGGTAPTYQWKVNGGNAGTNSPSFTSVFNNNDVVTVDLVSNSPCALPNTATSGNITVTHTNITANITINILSGNNPSCAGEPITFGNTTTNGGLAPQYQWLVNGAIVPAANLPTFTTTTLANGDAVSAVFIATDACVNNLTDTSNAITMVINPTDTPAVTIALTQGSNPGCLDSLVQFTATATNIGTNPVYTWMVNGAAVGGGTVFSSTTLNDGDLVTFRAVATDGGCHTTDTVVSDPVTMTLSTTPAAPIISFIGNMLVSNLPGPLVWFGPSGMIPGATGQSYHPTVPGFYYAVVSNNGCFSAASNKLMISLLQISNYNLDAVKIFPNPTSGQLTLDWGSTPTTVNLDVYSATGQGLRHDEVKNQTRKTLDLSNFANGVYFVVIRDQKGQTGTVRITVAK